MKPPLNPSTVSATLARLACVAVAIACAGAGGASAVAQATNPPPKAVEKKGPPGKGAPVIATVTPTNTPPKIVHIPKSFFVDKRGDGRDPFFPSSDRRQVRVESPVSPVTPVSPIPVPPTDITNATTIPVIAAPDAPKASDAFSVRGIIGGRKPSALLNSGVATYDFFQGDELIVKVRDGIKRVRCIEIKARTVTIFVEGEKEPRDLKLRPDL